MLEKKEWLEKSVQKYQDYESQTPRYQFIVGEKFPYKDKSMPLEITMTPLKKAFVSLQDEKILLHWPMHHWGQPASSDTIRQVLHRAYKHRALEDFQRRTEFWSQKMNLRCAGLSLRNQKTRWGSCSSKGTLSFNYRLIAAPDFVRDYIVVHELAHLVHMNHSRSFWALVESHYPQIEAAEKWLKKNGHALAFLA